MNEKQLLKIETEHAARMPTLDPENTRSTARDQRKKEAADWLGQYKWDPAKVRKALDSRLTARAVARREREDDDMIFISGIGWEKRNHEYEERFNVAKAYKEKIKTYSGDKDFASDELYRNRHEDLRRLIDEVEGQHIIDSKPKPMPLEQKQKKTGLFRRVMEWLNPPTNGHGTSVAEMMGLPPREMK